MKKYVLTGLFMLSLMYPIFAFAEDGKDQPASVPEVKMYDIMACNVYMDFKGMTMQKKQHKFLAAFYPTGEVPTPDLIEKITAYGPDGYSVDIKNQPFDHQNRNGWLYNPAVNAYWYMINVDKGFLKAGEYTVEVKLKNGGILKKSRVQDNVSADALLASYLKNRKKLYASHFPSQKRKMPADADLADVSVLWTPLKKMGGPDAYYIFRICEGKSGKEFDTRKVIWFNNIFFERLKNPDAGLNIDRVTIPRGLKARTHYVYFVEIADHNTMGQTNMTIFQPHHIFTTP